MTSEQAQAFSLSSLHTGIYPYSPEAICQHKNNISVQYSSNIQHFQVVIKCFLFISVVGERSRRYDCMSVAGSGAGDEVGGGRGAGGEGRGGGVA